MKSSTQDKDKGKIHKVKDDIREIAGKHINNPHLEREGKDEKITSNVQEKVSRIKKAIGR